LKIICKKNIKNFSITKTICIFALSNEAFHKTAGMHHNRLDAFILQQNSLQYVKNSKAIYGTDFDAVLLPTPTRVCHRWRPRKLFK
jgi:hypothetical protein